MRHAICGFRRVAGVALASSLMLAAGARAGDHDAHVHHVGMSGMSGMAGMAGMAGSGPAVVSDARHAIELTAEERNFVLTEMRAFLESVEGIVNGVAGGDMKAVAEAARRSGMMAMHNAPRSMMGKMPPEFRMLGMDTHTKFGALADEAAAMGDKQAVLKQLGALLANCGACHQGYRLVSK